MEFIKKMHNNTKLQILVFLLGFLCYSFYLGKNSIDFFIWLWPMLLIFPFRNCKSKIFVLVASVSIYLVTVVKIYGYYENDLADLMTSSIIFGEAWIMLMVDRYLYHPLKNKIGAFAVLLAPLVFACLVTIEKSTLGLSKVISISVVHIQTLAQSVSLIGSIGLVIFILCFSTAVLYSIERYIEKKKFWNVLCVYFGIAFVFCLYGSVRLGFNDEDGDYSVKFASALVAGYVPKSAESDLNPIDADIDYAKRRIVQASAGGADIICFCEENASIEAKDFDLYMSEIKESAKQNNIIVVVTLLIYDKSNEDSLDQDKIFVISGKGEIIGEYLKAKLIPGMESDSFEDGEDVPLYLELETKSGKKFNASFIICYDADIELYITNINPKTDVLVIPSWAWDAIDYSHTKVMKLRSIENGVDIINPANDGRSTANDIFGNTITLSDYATTGLESCAYYDMPIYEEVYKTPYFYIANYLLGLYILCTLAYIFMGIYFKIKK